MFFYHHTIYIVISSSPQRKKIPPWLVVAVSGTRLVGRPSRLVSEWHHNTHKLQQLYMPRRSVSPSEEVLMAAGLSRFPMVQCFYEQLEAIMEMRELHRAEQSSPSDDRSLSLGPLPSQFKLNTNGLCAVTHTFFGHSYMHMYSHTKHAQYHITTQTCFLLSAEGFTHG